MVLAKVMAITTITTIRNQARKGKPRRRRNVVVSGQGSPGTMEPHTTVGCINVVLRTADIGIGMIILDLKGTGCE